jgi:hypothetical protein
MITRVSSRDIRAIILIVGIRVTRVIKITRASSRVIRAIVLSRGIRVTVKLELQGSLRLLE